MNNKQINIFSFAVAFVIHSALLLFKAPAFQSHAQSSFRAINLSLETIPATIPANNAAAQQEEPVCPPKKPEKPTVSPKKQKPYKKDTADEQTIYPIKAETRFQEETGTEGTEPQLTASSPAASEINSYLALVRSQIERYKYYPRFSKKQDHQGTVLIKLDIAKNGSIVKTALLSSSGYNTLDKAALDAVRQSSPLPAPSDYGLRELSLDVPVQYMIR